MAVNGIVVKDTERELLIDAIRRVMAGEKVVQVDTGGGSTLLSRKLRDHGLTRREYDIMRHVAMGQTNRGDCRRARAHAEHGQDVRPASAGESRRTQWCRGLRPRQPTRHL